MIVRVAVVGEDRPFRRRLAQRIASDGVLVTTSPSAEHLRRSGKISAADIVVLRVEPGEAPDRVVAAISDLPTEPEVVVLATVDAPTEAKMIAAGASTVLSSELDEGRLIEALDAIVTRTSGSRAGREHQERFADTESSSPTMLELLGLADRVALGDAFVLVLGETGSGKEWLARRIHEQSRRASEPFVAVNCAAIPEGLAESELFGHVKGAFTGASRSRRGHFEMAHGGTLFLDEVGELPPGIQVRLLRALQDRSFQPVGSERPIEVDVRVMAATNQSLEEAVEEGRFRKDLYYRLAVVTLEVPPLRERREDIGPLVEDYARRFAHQMGKTPPEITSAARRRLEAYDWPGNIRELVNVIERAVLLGTGDTLDVTDLPAPLTVASPVRSAATIGSANGCTPGEMAYEEAFDKFERWYLSGLLESTGGRVAEAARRAGMSRRNLYNKIQRRGIRRDDFTG